MQALYRRDATQGMEHDQAYAFGSGKGANGGGTRIAGCGRHKRQGLVALFQRRVGQRRHHLHGHVLEGQGRAVPQLEHPQIVFELGQRRLAVTQECSLGTFRSSLDGLVPEDIDTEQGQQVFGQHAVIAAQVEIGCRIGFRHVEAAIGRQAIEQRTGKGATFAETACAEIVHSVTISAENVRSCAGSPLSLQARQHARRP